MRGSVRTQRRQASEESEQAMARLTKRLLCKKYRTAVAKRCDWLGTRVRISRLGGDYINTRPVTSNSPALWRQYRTSPEARIRPEVLERLPEAFGAVAASDPTTA